MKTTVQWMMLGFGMSLGVNLMIAEAVSLPEWFFYGGGIGGSWSGFSLAPDSAQLDATLVSPWFPGNYVTSVGVSSTSLLQIAPSTTYTLTLSARIPTAATASARMMLQSDVGVISSKIISGSAWQRYTNSFSTGSPADARVGRALYASLALDVSEGPGTSTTLFTNIQFDLTAIRPELRMRSVGVAGVELRWPTNFYWYQAQTSSNLLSGQWTNVVGTPFVQSNEFVLPVTPVSDQAYFRLRQD